MKTMTCRQLGGACEHPFHAETFDEIAALSKAHGGEMFQSKEPAHMAAMQKIMAMMNEPGAMAAWMEKQRNAFEALAKND